MVKQTAWPTQMDAERGHSETACRGLESKQLLHAELTTTRLENAFLASRNQPTVRSRNHPDVVGTSRVISFFCQFCHCGEHLFWGAELGCTLPCAKSALAATALPTAPPPDATGHVMRGLFPPAWLAQPKQSHLKPKCQEAGCEMRLTGPFHFPVPSTPGSFSTFHMRHLPFRRILDGQNPRGSNTRTTLRKSSCQRGEIPNGSNLQLFYD